MRIIGNIDNLLVKVALPLTQDTTQDRPAYIVVNIDGGLKEGTEGTTYCRAIWLQVFICGYSFYQDMVILTITRQGIYLLQPWLSCKGEGKPFCLLSTRHSMDKPTVSINDGRNRFLHNRHWSGFE